MVGEVIIDLGLSKITDIPVYLTLLGKSNLEAAGIMKVQEQPYLNLTGEGVLVGFIDTGIDYRNDDFKYEDDTSKIEYIWDQEIEGQNPKGYNFGAEYTNEEINEALKEKNPQNIIPHEDVVGHGTFLASISAGRGSGEYIRSCPRCKNYCSEIKKSKYE
jgi:subtilisin family serine protease